MKARHFPEAHPGILSAVGELCRQLCFDTVTLEADINPETTVYVDVVSRDCGGFDEIEITAVDVLKDTERRACGLPNIATYIGGELDRRACEMNREEAGGFPTGILIRRKASRRKEGNYY